MAIADLTSPAKTKKGPPCSVCEVIEQIDDDEAYALIMLLSDPTWRYTALSEELRKEGIDLAPFVLSRHARGACSARERLR